MKPGYLAGLAIRRPNKDNAPAHVRENDWGDVEAGRLVAQGHRGAFRGPETVKQEHCGVDDGDLLRIGEGLANVFLGHKPIGHWHTWRVIWAAMDTTVLMAPCHAMPNHT